MVFRKLIEPLERAISSPHGRDLVPLRTVSTYVDRRELSSVLEHKLNAEVNDIDSPYTLLIHGLGGTGKTQLALKYVEEHGRNYDPVLWIDAKDPESVLSSFERCAEELQLRMGQTRRTGTALANSQSVQAVLRFLRARKSSDKKWLVVVDNADEFGWGLQTVLPQAGWGNLIITSQDSQACSLFPRYDKLRVDIMGPLEARAALQQHLKWRSDPMPPHIQDLCDNIVGHLGHLTLAIALAGAYIGNEADQELALAQYLADYNRHQDNLLQRDYLRGLSESDKTVWTVWDKTLTRIQDLEPEARPDLLLAFLARFRGTVVPDEVFRLASSGLPVLKQYLGEETESLPAWLAAYIELDENQWDSFHYRTARDLLIRYNLLQRADGWWAGVTMHRLVQWRAKKWEIERPWDDWHLTFIAAAFHQRYLNRTGPGHRSISDMLDDNAVKMVASGFDESDKFVIEYAMGFLYFHAEKYKEAEGTLVRSLERSKKLYGDDAPLTLSLIDCLASTYRKQGQWKEAQELLIQALQIRNKILGENHLKTLTTMNDLAMIYWVQRRLQEAEDLAVHVLKMRQSVLGEGHLDTLISSDNVIRIYGLQGRLKEAEDLGIRATKIRKNLSHEETPDMLISLNSVYASYYGVATRWREIEELLIQVLEIRAKAFGNGYSYTLAAIHRIDWDYYKHAQWKESDELFIEVVLAHIRALMEENPESLTIVSDLADRLKSQGSNDRAIWLTDIYLKLHEHIFGPDPPDLETISLEALRTWGFKDGYPHHIVG